LSDYGYGFKTKILEAILTRTYVLITPRLRARIPTSLHRYCITVDPSPSSFAAALDSAMAPFPESDVNQRMRDEAFATLDAALAPSENPT